MTLEAEGFRVERRPRGPREPKIIPGQIFYCKRRIPTCTLAFFFDACATPHEMFLAGAHADAGDLPPCG